MKITDFFDKTFCINLERRSDRWEECFTEFNKYELTNIDRFIAVDGKELPQVTSGFVTPSRLALVLTNIKILEEAIENNYNSILILEDDVEFNDQVLNMDEYFKVLPKNWDMLYFGGNHNTHVGVTPPAKVNDLIVKLHHTYTTHMVAIKSHLFETIISLLGTYKEPIDVLYTELQKRYNVYCFYPGIAKQRKGYSDIQNRVDDNNLIIT
jgi:GR25 family glycosyltransferase involved in LPS biosynthesis